MMAANSGPIALPPLPPTWNIDWARLFFPPDAICATLDASGWKIEDPKPMIATEINISKKLLAMDSNRSPVRVKHIPIDSEYGRGWRSA